MHLSYACVMFFIGYVVVNRVRVSCLYLKYRSSTWFEYFNKYSSDSLLGFENANIYNMNETYHNRVIGCVFIILYTTHTCEYGPTSRFAHLF